MTIPFDFPSLPQGWICPKCGRVYAPTWPCCTHCNQEDKLEKTYTYPEFKDYEPIKTISTTGDND